jgi:hypothetical protein
MLFSKHLLLQKVDGLKRHPFPLMADFTCTVSFLTQFVPMLALRLVAR